jgi:hypothetical protein
MINTRKIPNDSTNCSKSAIDLLALDNNHTRKVPELRIKSQLNKIIASAGGKPDYLAINLYWDTFCSLHKKNNILENKGIYTNYQKLSEIHGVSKESIRKRIVKLEELGLVSRSFEQENKNSCNQLVIYVWQDTPHFFVSFARDKKEDVVLHPSTSHDYPTKKNGLIFDAQNKDPLNKGGSDA